MPTKPPKFGPTKRLEREYAAAIGKLARRVLPPKLPEQTFQEWLFAIAERSKQKDVEEAAEFLATRMVTAQNTLNQKTWRTAAAKWGQSTKLHRLLSKELEGPVGRRMREIIASNAAYIKSVPLEQASRLVHEIEQAQLNGARASTVAKIAKTRFPQLLKSRVQLISRTEVAKTSTALTRARSEEVGVDFYAWLTSEDVRVRLSHKKMNGVIIPWDQPPDPEALVGEKSTLGHYHSGECPNCRCTQRLILTLDDITFPAKVYSDGAVKTMTKQAFIARFKFTEERAA